MTKRVLQINLYFFYVVRKCKLTFVSRFSSFFFVGVCGSNEYLYLLIRTSELFWLFTGSMGNTTEKQLSCYELATILGYILRVSHSIPSYTLFDCGQALLNVLILVEVIRVVRPLHFLLFCFINLIPFISVILCTGIISG